MDEVRGRTETLFTVRVDIEREAEELDCYGEECEMHCALMDCAANVGLSALRLRTALTSAGFLDEKKGDHE